MSIAISIGTDGEEVTEVSGSTKKCPRCNDATISLNSIDRKKCATCGLELIWKLSSGQRPTFDGCKKDG